MNSIKEFHKGIVWLRRDLRLEDNRALFEAVNKCDSLYLVFVFDTNILKDIIDPSDQRLSFIQQSLINIESELKK